MVWFWFSVAIIFVLTVLALWGVVRYRRARLQNTFGVELTNQGNVECHFQLRAEESSRSLDFEFFVDGARLPQVLENGAFPPQSVVAHNDQAAKTIAEAQRNESSIGQKAKRTLNVGYSVARILTTVGSILPRSIGSSFTQAGSQMYRGQAQANRIQQVGNEASSWGAGKQNGRGAGPKTSPAASEADAAQAIAWAETAVVFPGQTLRIGLTVRSGWIAGEAIRAFQIKTRPTENAPANTLTHDGQAIIHGGFWSHPIYPSGVVVTIAILSLILAIVIARANGLPV